MQALQVEDEVLEQPAPEALFSFTTRQYHRLLETGILAENEPVELLDGLLVVKDRGQAMTLSPLHALIVSRLMRIAPGVEALGAHLRLQSPITFAPRSEPEPDAFIVRGNLEEYGNRHPGPEDVSCVIEVAESSLRRDRTTKRRIYAAAGIPQYLIANLVGRQVEIFEDPRPNEGRYGTRRLADRGDEITLQVPGGKVLKISAAQLLP